MGLKERRRASARFSRTVVVNALRLSWILMLLWGELGVFKWSLSSCKWPDTALGSNATHVLLVVDPQVRPPSSILTHQSLFAMFDDVLYEAYLKKAWNAVARLKPQVVFFLGDMLANGKHVRTESQYQEYVAKFFSVFPTDNNNTSTYFLAGNNDVGMGLARPAAKEVRRYHSDAFGQLNQQIFIRNHSFVYIDAPGLIDEDYVRSANAVPYEDWPPAPGGVISFVSTLPKDKRPVVLLSHIPLSRSDTAPCGPLREKGNIRKGVVGHGYQNTMGKQTSIFLLENLRPSLIFSGDNRDYCDYTHQRTVVSREVTVKSFSPVKYIRNPGLQLLSLVDPDSESSDASYADTLCLLPDKRAIYSDLYFPLAVLTIIILTLLNIKRSRNAALAISSLASNTAPLTSTANTWSPYTPQVPYSPRSSLPPSLRTPVPKSGPLQPSAQSPFLTSSLYGDEEEVMYPSQYVIIDHPGDETWSPDQEVDDVPYEERPAPKLPLQGSYLFSFRGRVRRITFPTWKGLQELVGLCDVPEMRRPRRGVMRNIWLDCASIGWVGIVTWMLILWSVL